MQEAFKNASPMLQKRENIHIGYVLLLSTEILNRLLILE